MNYARRQSRVLPRPRGPDRTGSTRRPTTDRVGVAIPATILRTIVFAVGTFGSVGLGQDGLARKLDPVLLVDGNHLHLDLVTHPADVGHALDVSVGEFA